jgi:uroporphyrin-III C-methyltransferase
MGTKKLPEIIKTYQANFKHDLPIAIIQSGTTKDQKLVAGTINDIQDKADREKVAAPAIIIIGEVVKESYRLKEIYQEVEKVSM